MRSFSSVSLLLLGAVLAHANAQHRRHVNDRDSENQIDSTGTPVEEPERHHEHRYHQGRHRSGRRHHGGSDHRSGANVSQAEETIEFHRYYMRNVRSLAEESGLGSNDVNTLLNIFEENRPPFKKEDRSQWTEEQWQKSKEEGDQRKQLIQVQAFEQIGDRVHLTIFFEKLETQKKLMKENIHKYIVARITRIAVSSGLNDTQIEKFIRELESHKPVGVHWRPGMSENEKKKNIEIHVRNWQHIKEACLRDASEAEQMQLKRFFAAVEEDFTKSMHREHHGVRRHNRRRPHHQLSRDPTRGHRRYQDHTETADVYPEAHRDQGSEERPRRHRHDKEDEDQTPMRRQKLRSEEVDDSEERYRTRHRRHHRHHRRPSYMDESEEREDSVPEHQHGRHQHRRQRKHHEEDSNISGEEREDDEFEPPRHRHHRDHHRHHHNRHRDGEETEESNARPEPYRRYRRPARLQDRSEE